MTLIKQINAEFNLINISYATYQELRSLMNYCYEQGDAVVNEDPDLSDALYKRGDEIQETLMDCKLTDDEVRSYITDIRDDVTIGGGFMFRAIWRMRG